MNVILGSSTNFINQNHRLKRFWILEVSSENNLFVMIEKMDWESIIKTVIPREISSFTV